MEKLAVIGAGLMGHSIAAHIAWQGMDVTLQGIDEADLDRAGKGIKDKIALLGRNDLLREAEETIAGRIAYTTSMEEAVSQCTFVIEAVPEDLELKQQLYRRLDSLCAPDVVLASNTSGLSPTAIADRMLHPQRMLVVHFWNPAHLIPLVEVVGGRYTSENSVARAMRLLRRLNKKAIEVKKDVPGFVGNRLQYALFREAQHLLETGVASAEDIDAAVTYSFGRRLPLTGPFMSADMGGLDVFHAISEYLFSKLSNAEGSTANMRTLVEQGHYGAKTGRGFYTWDSPDAQSLIAEREQMLIDFLKKDPSHSK